MLLGLPRLLTGDLLKVLCDMGHGDEIVIADANFPAYRCGQRVVELSTASACDVFQSLLKVMPLDHLGGSPICLMEVAKDDDCKQPVIWNEFKNVLRSAGYSSLDFEMIERFDFYERSKQAFAVIQTGEMALYGNLILRKGVVRNEVFS